MRMPYRSLDHGELVPRKAIEALPMKLRIGNRAGFLAHTRLAEGLVSLELPLVLFALHDIPLRRPRWRNVTGVGLRTVGYQLVSRRACRGRRRDILDLRVGAWL